MNPIQGKNGLFATGLIPGWHLAEHQGVGAILFSPLRASGPKVVSGTAGTRLPDEPKCSV